MSRNNIDYSKFASNPFEDVVRETNLRLEDTAQRILDGTYSPHSSDAILPTGQKNFCTYCGRRLTVTHEILECPSCGAPTE